MDSQIGGLSELSEHSIAGERAGVKGGGLSGGSHCGQSLVSRREELESID